MTSLMLVIGLLTGLLLCQAVLFWKLHLRQEKQYQMERENWERERERLLNRAMTRTWESYVQMSQSMNQSSDSYDPTPAKGMSDEEELRRFMGGTDGVGDVVFDMTDDLKELGIIQE